MKKYISSQVILQPSAQLAERRRLSKSGCMQKLYQGLFAKLLLAIKDQNTESAFQRGSLNLQLRVKVPKG